MESIELVHVGLALSEIGEIRRPMGDLDGAAEAFAKATENAAPRELQAVRTAFESLGAHLDLARVAELDAAFADPA